MSFLDSSEEFTKMMKEVDELEKERFKDRIKYSNCWWFIHPNDEKMARELLNFKEK